MSVLNPSSADAILARVSKGVSFFSTEDSYAVTQLLHDFKHSFLKVLYGDEFEENKELLLSKMGYGIPFETNVHYDVYYERDMLNAMHKWAAICLVTLEDHQTVIYTDSSRVSKIHMKKIMEYVERLQKQFGDRVVQLNPNEKVQFQTNEGFVNSCTCYAANKETLRGTGVKCKTGTVFVVHPEHIEQEIVSTIMETSTCHPSLNVIRLSLREGGERHSDDEKSS